MKKHMWAKFSIFTLVLLALFTWAELAHAQGVPNKPQSIIPWGFFYNDPYRIPLSPGDDAWFLSDNKSEAQNRDEIALVIDPSNGVKAQAVRSHLKNGGRLVILVGGYGKWGSPSEWMRPMITHVNDYLNAVVLQVNYQDAFSNLYPLSFAKGVDRVTQVVLKARRAGGDKIRIYGHSQGSDITARVVAIMASSVGTPVQFRAPYCWCWWYGQGSPEWFEGGFGSGNPADLGVGDVTVTSAAAPPPDGNGRRGGFYRYVGNYNGYYYGDKFVLFNRWNDPATYGGIRDIALIGFAGHSYRGVFSYPDLMTAFEEALTQPANTFGGPWGNGAYVNRGAGEEFDFADFHSVPFIPRADEMSRCTIRVGNAAPKYPVINEVARILVKFYDSNGGSHHEENIDLAENGSYELVNPMPNGGSAEVFSSVEITVVVDYDFEDNDRYFIASYPSESYPSNILYLPFLARGWGYGQNNWRQTTEMVLFNPGSQDASGEIEFNNGTPGIGNFEPLYHRFSIPPKGSFRLLTTLLPDTWSSPKFGAMASAIVRSNAPLSGMARNLIGDVGPYTGNVYRQYSESNYRAFATRGQNKMYAPLLISGRQGYESGMVVFNTSNRWVTFTVKFYAQGGGLVATSPLQTLYCRDMKVLITSDFLPASFKGTGFVGSAVVELGSPSPKETIVMIPQNVSPSGVTFYEGVPDGAYWYKNRAEIVDLPLLRDQRWQANTEWDSGINVVNMADGWEWVRIRYHNPDGGETLVTGWKLVSPQSSVTFWGLGEVPDYVPPALFEGSGKVEGSWQKKSGATVQVLRSGKEQKTYHDLLLSYSAWW